VSEKDVKRLIKQYSEMRRLMKRLKRDAGRIAKGLLEGLMRRGIGGPSSSASRPSVYRRKPKI
jgi:signal recognition particle GTPase